MAFDTLGVNVVASGIRGVANDIGHLALSFLRYIRAVEQADRASLKAAASQSKLADTMAGKAQRNVANLERKYGTLTLKARTLEATIQALNLTMRDPAVALSNYDAAVKEVQKYEQAIKNLEATARRRKDGEMYVVDARKLAPILAELRKKLNEANLELQKQSKNYAASIKEQAKYTNSTQQLAQTNEDLVDTEEAIADAIKNSSNATEDAIAKKQAYNNLVEQASQQTGIFGQMLSTLTGGFGQATVSSGLFSSILGQTTTASTKLAGGLTQTAAGGAALNAGLAVTAPQLALVMVAMDAFKLGLRAVTAVAKAVVSAVNLLWNALKKLVSIAWDAAKAIGKTLWSALTKIASAPFKVISGLFGNMGGSMQRVMEMAVGMNLSRVWWQLGMKMRDMAKSAAESATEYQVTFNRLRTLMLNEIVGTEYGGTTTIEQHEEALKKATLATQELVKWTSMLAVSTIYDAEDILNVYTLAMSYGFASTQAEKLTESVLDFATGMGLGDVEMKRIIENFGQMRAQGKITGTELRDLARGSFVPVNEVLEQMAKNAGLIGDYDIPNMQAINAVLQDMADNGELTADSFAAINTQLSKLGADGKITRQEFEGLVQEFSKGDVMQRFGLTAEQAGKALEGIKTGQLTEELNHLIATGKLTIDEFFDAFIEMAENKYPNAALSMGVTMKAVKSNIQDYIATMIGWRLIAPVFEVVAKHVQGFIQNTLMSEKQIAMFDRMGKAFKVVTDLVLTYSTAMLNARKVSGTFFGSGPLSQLRRFTNELLSMVGALGTEDFGKRFADFPFILKSIGLSFGSRDLVLGGIESLNDIMTDIMKGVDVDPEALKQSLDDVFGTLWKDFFGPTIKDAIDLAWSDYIAPAIDKLWKKMKDKFGKWKTEELIPGIKTFFGETLPGWISTFGTWIEDNGPKIVADLAGFVTDILNTFAGVSADTFGEDHWLTRLIELLSTLATYAGVKVADPTSELDKEALEDVTEAFDNFVTSVGTAIGQIDKVRIAIGKFADEDTATGLAHFTTFAGIYGDMLSIVGDTGAAIGLSILKIAEGLSAMAGGSEGISVLERLGAAIAYIVFLPVQKLLEVLDFVQKIVAWVYAFGIVANSGGTDGIADFFKTVSDVAGTMIDATPLTKSLDSIAESMKNFANIVAGEDVYNAAEKARDFLNKIRGFLGMELLEGEPTEIEVPLEPKPTLPEDTGINFRTAVQGAVAEAGTGDVDPTEMAVPVHTTLSEITLGNGKEPFTMDSLFTNILDNANLDTSLAPINIPMPTINIEGDFTAYGESLGKDLVAGFSTGITADMALVEIPLPATPETKSIGEALIQGIINGINQKLPSAISAAQAAAQAIANAMSQLWRIESPSKLFMGFGANLMKGLEQGIAGGTEGAMAVARDAATDIKQGVGAITNSNNRSYVNTTNTSVNNWNIKMSTPIIASTQLQAYEILRMRAA